MFWAWSESRNCKGFHQYIFPIYKVYIDIQSHPSIEMVWLELLKNRPYLENKLLLISISFTPKARRVRTLCISIGDIT